MKKIIKSIALSLGYFILFILVTNLVKIGFMLFYYFSYADLRVADYAAYTKLVQTLMYNNITLIGMFQYLAFLLVIVIIFKE